MPLIEKKRAVDNLLIDKDVEEKKRKIEIEINRHNNIVSEDNKNEISSNKVLKCLAYFYGIGVEKNMKKARRICLKYKEENIILRGLNHLQGWEGEKDERKSLEYLEEYLEKEEGGFSCNHREMAEVLNLVGYQHQNGLGVEQNHEKAIEYYIKAIELGNSSAMTNLAIMFQKGILFELKYVKEEHCNEEGGEEGEIEIISFKINLNNKKNTRRYKRDLSSNNKRRSKSKKKNKKPIKLTRKSSERHHPSSHPISKLLGEGSAQDKAFHLLHMASELGNSEAMHHLACMYQKGVGTEKDDEKAHHFFQKSGEMNHADSLYHLAFRYYKGIGVEKDIHKSFQLFERSSDLGNIDAKNNLAFMYLQGIGVEKDEHKAFLLYEESSELGNIHAMNNLACLYKDGKVVERNTEKFIHYLQKSSDFGNYKATNNLACVYLEGKDVEKNVKKAIQLFRKSSELGGYREATSSLAFIYENVEINLEKAAYYYFKLFQTEQNKDKKDRFRKKLFGILSQQKTEWKLDYHQFWPSSSCLDDKIFTLLLISKFRVLSTKKHTAYLVKGVMINIIKYLCHYHQQTNTN